MRPSHRPDARSFQHDKLIIPFQLIRDINALESSSNLIDGFAAAKSLARWAKVSSVKIGNESVNSILLPRSTANMNKVRCVAPIMKVGSYFISTILATETYDFQKKYATRHNLPDFKIKNVPNARLKDKNDINQNKSKSKIPSPTELFCSGYLTIA
jgi:hypothetical protein